MIIGYARVSSEEQNLAMQLDALKVADCSKVFKEKISGTREDRPELNKCLKFLQKGDTLVVFKLDRLGRSLRHLVNTVLDLNERGVSLVVTTMAIDTRTPHGKLLFGILASVAEFERSLIKERQAAGIKAAKARGVKFGPPIKLTPELIERATREIAKGRGVCSVAAELGVGKSRLYANMARHV